jgi:hypothetical protein
MSLPFARGLDRLHRLGSRRLADSIGTFQAQGCAPVPGLDLQIDRNLEMEGAGGRFMTNVIGISWHASALASAKAGDLFVVGAERFIVEKLLADDGHMITAACMVQK